MDTGRKSLRIALDASPGSAPVPIRPAASRPKIVSLFAGAGGLDLGFLNVGFEVPIAFDSSAAAIESHKANFLATLGVVADLIKLRPAGVARRVRKVIQPGSTIGVIGGPPCQGFSRANTNAKEDDPRNSLPRLYLRIIKELQKSYDVDFIVFENVLGIRDKRHISKFEKLLRDLGRLGFQTHQEELCALDFGVPQVRRRIIVSGVAEKYKNGPISPRPVLGLRSVRDAIGNIAEQPLFFRRGISSTEIPVHPNHWTMQPKSVRFQTPDAIRSDGRSFKKLLWDAPSPTVAYGNREIHVHPNGTRRLSVFEAMLLQGFPSSFVLKGTLSDQVLQVSNAVPPPLAEAIARAVESALGFTCPNHATD